MTQYIANIFFETEIEGKAGNSLQEAFNKNPYFNQLQFLPLLYLSEEDSLLVSVLPDHGYMDRLKAAGIAGLPKIRSLDEWDPHAPLHSWGGSQIIEKWAKERKLRYEMPEFELSKKINSKIWNFEKHAALKQGGLVFSKDELVDKIEGSAFRWVLKTDQGFAGRGHCLFEKNTYEKAAGFAAKEWKAGRPVIVEPWVARLMDFSSQWVVSKERGFKLLGVTKCLNTPSGVYLGTEAGARHDLFSEYLPYVELHLEACKTHINQIAKEGFFGHLGVDAMVYIDPETNHPALYAILEVNARMTMSCAILLYHLKHGKNKVTQMVYSAEDSTKPNLLPEGHRRLVC